MIDTPVLLPLLNAGVVLASLVMLGSLMPGLAGVIVGALIEPTCGSVVAGVLTILFSAERSRQPGGQPRWRARPWLLTAGCLTPLLLAALAHQPALLAPPVALNLLTPNLLTLSLLVLSAVGIAAVCMGRPGQPAVDGWTILNSLCGYAMFGLCCVGLLMILPLLMMLPQRQRRMTALMRWGMRMVLRSAPGVTWHIDSGVEMAMARVVVANHHSVLDILCLCALPGDERTFLAKPWVLRAPLLGWVARGCGIVSTAAVNSADFLTGKLSGQTFTSTRSVVIFASGRRDDGVTRLRFRPGAFVLAAAWHSPVLPVALCGTDLALPRTTWWIRPGHLTCRALPGLEKIANESVRQQAERTRCLISDARTHQLAEDLLHGRQQRWLDLWAVGQRMSVRHAMRREQQAQRALAGLLRTPLESRPWLIVGLGWSTAAHTLRLMYPHTPLLAVDADATLRNLAHATWFRPATDQLAALLPTALPPLAGVFIAMQVADLEPIIKACDAHTQILVAAPCAATWATRFSRQVQVDSRPWAVLTPPSMIEPDQLTATVCP